MSALRSYLVGTRPMSCRPLSLRNISTVNCGGCGGAAASTSMPSTTRVPSTTRAAVALARNRAASEGARPVRITCRPSVSTPVQVCPSRVRASATIRADARSTAVAAPNAASTEKTAPRAINAEIIIAGPSRMHRYSRSAETGSEGGLTVPCTQTQSPQRSQG